MNSHPIQHVDSEKFSDVMHSIELFVAIVFFTSLVAFLCVAIA